MSFANLNKSPIGAAIYDEVVFAKKIIDTLPVQATYNTEQARYYWLVVAGMLSQTVQLIDAMKGKGGKGGKADDAGDLNAEYTDDLQAIITKLFRQWDTKQIYRQLIYTAVNQKPAPAPTVTFRDIGFKDDLIKKLGLLMDAAFSVADIDLHVSSTGQNALYNFLAATNQILRGVGAGIGKLAMDALIELAKIPGRIVTAAVGSFPWGKTIFFLALATGIVATAVIVVKRKSAAPRLQENY